MKKFLLATSLVVAAGIFVSAQQLPIADREDPQFTTARIMVDPSAPEILPSSRAITSIDYRLAGDVYSFLGLRAGNSGLKVGYAMEIVAEDATLYAGSQITKVNFYSGTNASQTTNDVTDYTIVIYKNLSGSPIYTQDCKASTTTGTLNQIELTEPVTLTAGESLYVGVQFVIGSTGGYYIPIDDMMHSTTAGGWFFNGDSWINIADDYGFVCMSATIEGNIPENAAQVSLVTPKMSYVNNEAGTLQIAATNRGSGSISSMQIAYQIGGMPEETVDINLSTALKFGQSGGGTINNIVIPSPGYCNIKARVTKVNGQDNNLSDKGLSAQAMCVPKGWEVHPNMVIEEFTGTWCGYCPRGIVAMERITKEFTDGTVIPIAIHASSGSSTDPMQASTYMPVVERYVSGFPSALLNRRGFVELSSQINNIIKYQSEYQSNYSVADIELEAQFTDARVLKIDASTKFAFNIEDNADFSLAFVVTEDKVGPYNQTNYFAGGGNGAMGGWESKGGSVSTIYNEVARVIDSAFGIEESVPSTIQANHPYEFSRTISLGRTVKPENCNVIAILLNNKTGEIETGKLVKNSEITSGLTSVETASELIVEGDFGSLMIDGVAGEGVVYNPAGAKVASFNGSTTISLPAGLYIVACDGQAVKVVVR